jgi:hypothetical protein
MALINLSLKCGCHRDVHNCNQTPSMMCVLVISRFVLVNDVPSRVSVISLSFDQGCHNVLPTRGQLIPSPYSTSLTSSDISFPKGCLLWPIDSQDPPTRQELIQ